MASTSDIAQVRLNANEPTQAPFDDDYIGGLIDSVGVAGATVSLWESKAALIAETAVDVTEADATHKLSDKFDHANAMIKYWRGVSTTVEAELTGSVVRVRKIVRS